MDHKIEPPLLLDGLRVLVVDDEILIATDLGESFREDGAEVLGPFTTLSSAVKAAEEEMVSVAVLDYRLGRETTEAVADILLARKIPFLFCTGGAIAESLQARLPMGTVLLKPIRYHVLLERIAGLTGRTAV